MKVLLIGEAAPDGVEPMKGDAGKRFAKYAEIDGWTLFELFDVANVLDRWPGRLDGGDAWPMDDARAAMEKLWDQQKWRRVVLLGSRVRSVHPRVEVRTAEFFKWVSVDRCRVATMPHPSGRNRWYNDSNNVKSAVDFLRDLVVMARMLLMVKC